MSRLLFDSWPFTTLAVAAKHPMTSIPGFVAIETGFTVIQFLLVGPLWAVAARSNGNRFDERVIAQAR